MLQYYQGVKTLSQTQFYPVKTPTHSYFEMNLVILKGILLKRIWKKSTQVQVSPWHEVYVFNRPITLI